MKSYRIRISSHDRDRKRGNESNSRFTINTRVNNLRNISFVALKIDSVHIPNIFPNVPQNSAFRFNIGGVERTVYVNQSKSAYETSSTLCTKLDTLLTSYSVSVRTNPNDETVEFTQTGGSVFYVYPADRTNNYVAYLLGFSQDIASESTTISGDTISPRHEPRLNVDNSCCVIQSRAFGQPTYDVSAPGNGEVFHLVSVPMDVPYGVYAHYSPPNNSDTLRWSSPKPLSNTWDFKLRNWHGEIMDIGDHDWSMVITLIYN